MSLLGVLSARPTLDGPLHAWRLHDVNAGWGRANSLKGLTATAGTGLTLVQGAPGAGKSTLIAVLTGELAPRRGKAWVAGRRPTARAARAARVVASSRIGLRGELTLGQHAELVTASGATSKALLDERLERHGLHGWDGVNSSALPHSVRRRAWTVFSTARPAPIALLDAPFDGLDAQESLELSLELVEWSAAGREVLVTSRHAPPGLSAQQIVTL